jgi:hypothetical protein
MTFVCQRHFSRSPQAQNSAGGKGLDVHTQYGKISTTLHFCEDYASIYKLYTQTRDRS